MFQSRWNWDSVILLLFFLKVIQRLSSEAEIFWTVISKFKRANISWGDQLPFPNSLAIKTELRRQYLINWRNKQ